jgi:Transmembrane family 220, helix
MDPQNFSKPVSVYFRPMKSFNLFAGLQYNDPDPLLWIPIYLFAAFLCWKAYKGIYHKRLMWLGLGLYGLYAVYLLLDKNGVLSWANEHAAESLVTSMKAEKPWIEETREFGGLLILIAVFAVNLFKAPEMQGSR